MATRYTSLKEKGGPYCGTAKVTIAGLVSYLANPAAAFVTGTNIRVDGGVRRLILPRIEE